MRGTALLLCLAASAACHHRAAAPVPVAPAVAGPTLYQRLGGLEAIRAVVNDFDARITADARINAFFRGLDDEDFRAKLTAQICEATGGPCHYSGRTMRAAHAQLNVSNADFDALVGDLTASLDHFGVGAREQSEFLGILGGLRKEIVTRK